MARSDAAAPRGNNSVRSADWRTLLLCAAMYALLAGNVILYVYAPMNPVVHVLIGAVAIHLSFTIWHEAVHATVSRRRWVNNLVGIVGMLPYMTPYFMQKWVHLEHHRRLNLENDPNFIYTDGPFITLPLRYVRALRYAKALLKKDPRTARERGSDAATLLLIGGVHLVALWQGVLVDLLLLWFVPLVLAKLVMDWYINYLPHVGLPPDKFAGTRILDVRWFTPLVLGHNYHAVHHLWPSVPWYQYRSVYTQKLAYLQSHGVPIEHAVFSARQRIPRAEQTNPLPE